jgi:hypothetical protein
MKKKEEIEYSLFLFLLMKTTTTQEYNIIVIKKIMIK